jgi:hypothetical protein
MSTRPGRRPVATRPRKARKRTAGCEAIEITVSDSPRHAPDLQLVAQALLIVARDLASKAREELANDGPPAPAR